jgi:hypothetical protein
MASACTAVKSTLLVNQLCSPGENYRLLARRSGLTLSRCNLLRYGWAGATLESWAVEGEDTTPPAHRARPRGPPPHPTAAARRRRSVARPRPGRGSQPADPDLAPSPVSSLPHWRRRTPRPWTGESARRRPHHRRPPHTRGQARTRAPSSSATAATHVDGGKHSGQQRLVKRGRQRGPHGAGPPSPALPGGCRADRHLPVLERPWGHRAAASCRCATGCPVPAGGVRSQRQDGVGSRCGNC